MQRTHTPLHLSARPGRPDAAPLAAGEHRLRLADERDVTLVVPPGLAAAEPAPLVVCLHGAGSAASQRLRPLERFAVRAGALLLGPDSVAATWDLIVGEPGPDVARIDAALAWTFQRFRVDPERIAIEGFSDGASYALTLGLANGDLFRRIFAFSPGFNAARRIVGKPRVFITHGIFDPVLPVACSRRIVPPLRAAGLDVEYHEFHGVHTVPARFAEAAFATLREAD